MHIIKQKRFNTKLLTSDLDGKMWQYLQVQKFGKYLSIYTTCSRLEVLSCSRNSLPEGHNCNIVFCFNHIIGTWRRDYILLKFPWGTWDILYNAVKALACCLWLSHRCRIPGFSRISWKQSQRKIKRYVPHPHKYTY